MTHTNKNTDPFLICACNKYKFHKYAMDMCRIHKLYNYIETNNIYNSMYKPVYQVVESHC